MWSFFGGAKWKDFNRKTRVLESANNPSVYILRSCLCHLISTQWENWEILLEIIPKGIQTYVCVLLEPSHKIMKLDVTCWHRSLCVPLSKRLFSDPGSHFLLFYSFLKHKTPSTHSRKHMWNKRKPTVSANGSTNKVWSICSGETSSNCSTQPELGMKEIHSYSNFMWTASIWRLWKEGPWEAIGIGKHAIWLLGIPIWSLFHYLQ
jgi:hypothetical protein